MSSGTASTGLFGEFASAVMSQLWSVARHMSPERLQRFIQRQDDLREVLQQAFGAFTFRRDKTREGWKLLEDVDVSQLLLPEQLVLVQLLQGTGRDFVYGEELVSRAKSMQANLGQHQAEYLLMFHEEIPERWRLYDLPFSGTVWQSPHGPAIPVLICNGRVWDLTFQLLGSSFDRIGVLTPRK